MYPGKSVIKTFSFIATCTRSYTMLKYRLRKFVFPHGSTLSLNSIIRKLNIIDITRIGLAIFIKLIPADFNAVISFCWDNFPKVISTPVNTAIGIVIARKEGRTKIKRRRTSCAGTPFDIIRSRRSITWKIRNIKVKTNRPRIKAEKNSPSTYEYNFFKLNLPELLW